MTVGRFIVRLLRFRLSLFFDKWTVMGSVSLHAGVDWPWHAVVLQSGDQPI